MSHDPNLKFVDGFPIYGEKQIGKVNALRKVNSQVGIESVPILDRGSVSFSTAESAHDEPRSCLNCPFFFSEAKRCELIGPRVVIDKFIEGKPEGKNIEFWPVCDYWIHGSPSHEPAHYKASLDPDDAGLVWVNAPEVGLELSGTSCGGGNDADDCDFWISDSEGKFNSPTGFCRVLQSTTGTMDCCNCWRDDDEISWRTAQQWLR